MIPEVKIAEIRERADIVEVIGQYVVLKKAGVNYKGVCPFHGDSDPSFNVNQDRQFFHCFGCNASGDVFTFLQKIEGFQFIEAAESLADKYSIELPREKMSSAALTLQEQAREQSKRRLFIIEEATLFFEAKLWSEEGKIAQDSLQARGIDVATAKEFRLGYAPDMWTSLLDHLQSKRVSVKEVEMVGLALPRKSSSGYYDRFRNRLVFTITDASGHPVAFSARILPGDDSSAKYINSPETREYTKGKVLYGLNQARVHISKAKEVVLVEGNFDVVSLANAGIKNVIAPLGTAFTEEHAALLQRRVERVIVMFDGDKAGRTAAARAFIFLAKVGLASYLAPLPDGEDPDSLIRKDGKDAVLELIKNKKGLLDEIISASALASDGSTQDVARRITKLAPFLNAVSDSREWDMYPPKIASYFRINPSLVFRYLRGGKVKEDDRIKNSANILGSPGKIDERELIGLLLDLPQLCDEAVENGTISLITTPQLRKIADELILNHRNKNSSVSELMTGAEKEPAIIWLARRGIDRLYTEEENGRKALSDIKDKMEKNVLSEQTNEINHQILKAHTSGSDINNMFELMKKRTEIEKDAHKANEAFDKDQNSD